MEKSFKSNTFFNPVENFDPRGSNSDAVRTDTQRTPEQNDARRFPHADTPMGLPMEVHL